MNEKQAERETEDEITQRKLGPRGVPNGPDISKMTKRQKEQTPKSLEPGHTA